MATYAKILSMRSVTGSAIAALLALLASGCGTKAVVGYYADSRLSSVEGDTSGGGTDGGGTGDTSPTPTPTPTSTPTPTPSPTNTTTPTDDDEDDDKKNCGDHDHGKKPTPIEVDHPGNEENPGSIDDISCGNSGGKKVLICHVPSGNPSAAHTLCIPIQAAVRGHRVSLPGQASANSRVSSIRKSGRGKSSHVSSRRRGHDLDYAGACRSGDDGGGEEQIP